MMVQKGEGGGGVGGTLSLNVKLPDFSGSSLNVTKNEFGWM